MMAKSNKRRDEERRKAAAERVAQMRKQQLAAERRRRTLMVGGGVLAVIVIIVAIAVVVLTHNAAPTVASNQVRGTTKNFGVLVGKPTAPAKMIAYEDFQCPICRQFETTNGTLVNKYIKEGKLQVEYRTIAFLDRESSTNYSTRSLNAAACVRNYYTAEIWKIFHDVLFANQPEEGSAGLPDSQLITYAKAAGAKSTQVEDCINNQTFKDWTASATDASSKAGVTGTPTITINGETIDSTTWANASLFQKALDAAVASGKSGSGSTTGTTGTTGSSGSSGTS